MCKIIYIYINNLFGNINNMDIIKNKKCMNCNIYNYYLQKCEKCNTSICIECHNDFLLNNIICDSCKNNSYSKNLIL